MAEMNLSPEVKNEMEALRSDLLNKPPLLLQDGQDEQHGLSDRRLYRYFIQAQGLLLQFADVVQVTNRDIYVAPGMPYILVVTAADRFNVQYGFPGLQAGEEEARVYVIAIQEMIDFDIPMRANRDTLFIVRPGIVYQLAQYSPFGPLQSLNVPWPMTEVTCSHQTDHFCQTFGILEYTKLRFIVQAIGYICVLNFSRTTVANVFEGTFRAMEDWPPHLPLNDSWSADLCDFTNITNEQKQLPVIDTQLCTTMQHMTLERYSLRVNTEMYIRMHNQSQNRTSRNVNVFAGQRYLLVCNRDDLFRIKCLPGVIDREAVIRVVAMNKTPENFIIPMRPNRSTYIILVHDKILRVAMVPAIQDVDYNAIAKYNEELRFPREQTMTEISEQIVYGAIENFPRQWTFTEGIQRVEQLEVGKRLTFIPYFKDESSTVIIDICAPNQQLPETPQP